LTLEVVVVTAVVVGATVVVVTAVVVGATVVVVTAVVVRATVVVGATVVNLSTPGERVVSDKDAGCSAAPLQEAKKKKSTTIPDRFIAVAFQICPTAGTCRFESRSADFLMARQNFLVAPKVAVSGRRPNRTSRALRSTRPSPGRIPV
tara:strand:- start:2496 stop:2939 length:444 start_codon:yes stop_codon:yes gene_type:complete